MNFSCQTFMINGYLDFKICQIFPCYPQKAMFNLTPFLLNIHVFCVTCAFQIRLVLTGPPLSYIMTFPINTYCQIHRMYLIVSSHLCVKSDLSFTKLITTLFFIWSSCIIIQLRPLDSDVPIYMTISDTECIVPYSWTLMSCCINPWRWLFLYTSRYQPGLCFNNTFICLYLWYSDHTLSCSLRWREL